MTSPKLLLLPFELVEEILYRTPIEALFRFKSVSKQWYALFNDKRFIYKHLDHSKERLVLVNHKSIQLFNLESKALSSCHPTPDELHNYKIITRINHCDGLLLCSCGERGIHGEIKLAVLNPVLSRIKWIQLPNPSSDLFDVFGFGYDHVSRDNYKILRIGVTFDIIKGRLSSSSSYIEIYELKSKLWRSVDATLPSTPPWISVSMNGNMYWIAQKKMVNSRIQLFIESFDFSTETFKPLCCVPNGIADRFSSDDHDTVLSCFRGDRLSLLHRQKHVTTELWVTSKVTDDGIVSWSNYFNVSLPDPSPMLSSSFSRTTFILETNKIILCCEDSDIKNKAIYTNFYEIGDEGKINKVDITEVQREWVDAKSWIAYVPSLVPVPE